MSEKKNLQNFEEVFTQDLLRFVDGRMWDVAVGKYGILETSTSTERKLLYQGEEVFDGGGSTSLDDARRRMAAIRHLRDHLLQTTGRRIWGLTLTLYPDGKFNVEYDYNKPADYEEDESTAATADASPLWQRSKMELQVLTGVMPMELGCTCALLNPGRFLAEA